MPSSKSKQESTSFALSLALGASVCATIGYTRVSRARREKKETDLQEAKLHALKKLERAHRSSVVFANATFGLNPEEEKPPGTLLTDVTIDEVYLWEVEHLSKRFKSEAPSGLVNHMLGTSYKSAPLPEDAPTFLGGLSGSFDDDKNVDGDAKSKGNKTAYNKLIGVNECILADIARKPNGNSYSKAFIRAGPRGELHFNPNTVNAAIVTCGGLCPGLNNV